MHRNRLFWPTREGRDCQAEVAREYQRSSIEYDYPLINWQLYAQVVSVSVLQWSNT